MAISYNRTNWVNDTSPFINATNLNNIENGIENATTEVNTKAQIDLCWQNSSMTSEWTSTTRITANNLGTYDAAIVIYKISTGDVNYISEFVVKDVNTRTSAIWNYKHGRTCNFTSSGLSFGTGYSAPTATTEMASNNGACIPYRIYGVKARDLT